MEEEVQRNRAEKISKLFLERSRFVVIGLTGRTGSGCTTASRILESKIPSFPSLGDAEHEGASLFPGLSGKRYVITKKYAESNWRPFYAIKVSDLISVYLLSMTPRSLMSFILDSSGDPQAFRTKVNALFKKEYLKDRKSLNRYEHFQRYLIDHDEGYDFSEEKLIRFSRYLLAVRKFTRDFKEDLKGICTDLYVKVYQNAGVSIRKLGVVDTLYKDKALDLDSVFHLPETMNRVIKLIRESSPTAFVVIDAIRNVYEARFFKDRYSAFYLASVNAPSEDRSQYLTRVHKFTADQLAEIDKKESGEIDKRSLSKEDVEDSKFIEQNVKKCIEISDIHLFNPRNEIDNNNVLKAQLAWYFSLMLHPGLVSPTSMERVMQIAYTAKSNSGCISRQVGAAITDDNYSIKAVGWNDVPEGQIPCALRSVDGLINHFDPVIYSEYERKNEKFREEVQKKYNGIIARSGDLRGRNLSYCFKDLKNTVDPERNQVHTRSLHAEENAFLQITKYGGQSIEGGKLFTTASPCELCAKKAYQLGVKEIVYIDPYPGIATSHVLSIGRSAPNLVQFRGAVGKGYHLLYEQALPYKDELEYFIK